MKSIFLCVLLFLFAAVNSFSQVLQKKQTTAPVIQKQITAPQKPEQKKIIPQTKTGVINPAIEQSIAHKDTENAKLTDVIIAIGFRSASDATTDVIRAHYKPQIFLFDKDNRNIASWAEEDYTLSALENQNGLQRHQKGYRVFSFHMKIDSKNQASYASIQKGTITIRNVVFSNKLFQGQDYFIIDDLYITLKFLNPLFNTPIGYQAGLEHSTEPVSYDDELNLNHPSAAFSFSCNSPYYGILNPKPLY